MIAIPALDLQAPLGQQPLAMTARALEDLGYGRLQIVDRQAADHTPSRLSMVEDILRDTNARVQVEGVATTTDIDQLLRIGVDHVVVGARAIDEPEWLANITDLYPEAISLVTNVHDRRVVRRGWVRTLPVDILDLVEELNDFPLRELIVSVRSFDAANRSRHHSKQGHCLHFHRGRFLISRQAPRCPRRHRGRRRDAFPRRSSAHAPRI